MRLEVPVRVIPTSRHFHEYPTPSHPEIFTRYPPRTSAHRVEKHIKGAAGSKLVLRTARMK